MSYTEFVEKTVKTRKTHICAWCGEEIKKGETVPYREYLFDGQFNKDWMHVECSAAMNTLDSYDLAEGWMPGMFIRGSTEER